MKDFHDFDPWDVLQEIQETQYKLIRNFNQQEQFLADLVNQHNSIVELIKKMRSEITELQRDRGK